MQNYSDIVATLKNPDSDFSFIDSDSQVHGSQKKASAGSGDKTQEDRIYYQKLNQQAIDNLTQASESQREACLKKFVSVMQEKHCQEGKSGAALAMVLVLNNNLYTINLGNAAIYCVSQNEKDETAAGITPINSLHQTTESGKVAGKLSIHRALGAKQFEGEKGKIDRGDQEQEINFSHEPEFGKYKITTGHLADQHLILATKGACYPRVEQSFGQAVVPLLRDSGKKSGENLAEKIIAATYHATTDASVLTVPMQAAHGLVLAVLDGFSGPKLAASVQDHFSDVLAEVIAELQPEEVIEVEARVSAEDSFVAPVSKPEPAELNSEQIKKDFFQQHNEAKSQKCFSRTKINPDMNWEKIIKHAQGGSWFYSGKRTWQILKGMGLMDGHKKLTEKGQELLRLPVQPR